MEDEDFVFDDEACGDDPIVEAAYFEMVMASAARDDSTATGG
ncbi:MULTISPECIES: hypothetical protein [Bradyrhizobium]|uniref:Uncharacterized protein n=1 Tax=Bradyrhizobium elkanii TaxID=29448 RepID=A0A8I1Y971_BRAEL|nr:hypothetical protein [Bradyrhizobium elkanii]MBP1294314.1 hypothetical protein [Bradyrhizobium elkanii]